MSGPCANHPAADSTKECAGCHRVFCDSCIVELGGWTYCGNCKNSVVASSIGVQEFKLPNEALLYAVVGIFCCGIILEPIAIWKGADALMKIGKDPRLPGKGTAIAAIVLASIILILNVGLFAARFSGIWGAF